jgi:hypothetical protein
MVSTVLIAIYAPMIYTVPYLKILMRADPLRGQVGGGWAGPKKVENVENGKYLVSPSLRQLGIAGYTRYDMTKRIEKSQSIN